MSDPIHKTSKQRVQTADIEACYAWLIQSGNPLAASHQMAAMLHELLERRASDHETMAPQSSCIGAWHVPKITCGICGTSLQQCPECRVISGHRANCSSLREPVVAPYLLDRANGVAGVYCIARVRNGTSEYWTGQEWAAFCNDFLFDLRGDQKASVRPCREFQQDYDDGVLLPGCAVCGCTRDAHDQNGSVKP